MTVEFHVTAEHIQAGTPARGCPVELAMCEAIPGLEVVVGTALISVIGPSGAERCIPTPLSVAEFVRHFDAGLVFRAVPFSFGLDLPAEIMNEALVGGQGLP